MDIGTLTATLAMDTSMVDAATRAFGKFQKSTISSLSMMSQRLRTFGYLASVTLTAPMVAVGKMSISAAKDFEFSMQKIVGLTGTAQQAVNSWQSDVFSISREFGKKPQELAESLYYIASSGIRGAEALNVLRVSAKAAASGLGETQSVADYVTSVLNAYRGTNISAAEAVDVLVAAVREGKAEASGFASAMGQVIPIAAQLGVEIDQVAGAMAAITLTGSSSAQAATYLKNIFNALLKEAGNGAEALTQASQALTGMNTSFADLRKVLRDQGVMALMGKMRDLSANYGETLVSKVFPEIRAMTGALSLMGKNFEYNTRLMDRVTNSQGSLAVAFNAVANTIKVKYDRAISSLNVSLITLGKDIAIAFLPILEKLVEKLDVVTKWFESLTEAQKRQKIMIALLIAAGPPLLLLISTLGYGLVGLMNILNLVSGAFRFLFTTVSLSSVLSKFTAALRGVALSGTAAAGALEGTAVATGLTMTSFISATAMLGAFAIAAYVLIDNVFVPLINKIKDMRKEMEETLAIAHETDVQMNLDTSISSKLWNGNKPADLGQYSQQTLEKLQTDIQQRIALERDDLDNAKTINDEKIKQEEGYLKKIKELGTLETKWKDAQYQYNVEHTIGPYDLQAIGSNIAMRKQMVQKSMNDYIKNRQYEVQYDREASESVIGYYQKQEVAVSAALKAMTDPIAEAEEAFKILMERTEEVNEAFSKLTMGEKAIAVMIKLFGGSFDDISEKISLYKEVLKSLIDIQTKAGYAIPEVTNKINKLVGELSKLEQIQIERELQNISGLGAILGTSFDVNAAKVNIMRSAIEDFNLKTKGTASTFGSMGVSGLALQMVLDGLTIRWNKYKEAAVSEDYQKTISYLESQRDAFGTISSEIDIVSAKVEGYKKYMDFLYESGQKGSGMWYVLADAIKNAEIQLQGLQGEESILPLQAMVDTFGRFEDKTNLASAQMDIARDKMELLVLQGKQFSVEYQAASVSYQHWMDVLRSAEAAETVAPLQAMYESFGGLNNQIAVVSAQVEAAREKFVMLYALMAAGVPGAGIGMEAAREELNNFLIEAEKLQRVQQIYNQLGSAIADISGLIGQAFGGSEDAMTKIVDVVLSTAQSIISIFLAEAAAAILAGETIKGMGLPGLIVGMIGVGVLMTAWEGYKSDMEVSGLAKGGLIPQGYPNDSFPAMLTSGELVIPKDIVEKIPKLAGGGIIPNGYPNDSFAAFLSSGESVLPVGGTDELSKKIGVLIKVIDTRLIDAITGLPVPDTRRLGGEFETAWIKEVVTKSLEKGIDPYTSLAIAHQETGGQASEAENPFRVIFKTLEEKAVFAQDEIGNSLNVLNSKLELAKNLGKDTYAEMVQVYNGTGRITSEQFGSTKAYGLEIPMEGFSMKENPLYGKRIEDIRNNILMQNEDLVSYIDMLSQGYASPSLPYGTKKKEEPIEKVSGIEGDLTPIIGNVLTSALSGEGLASSLSGMFSGILTTGLTAVLGPAGGFLSKLLSSLFGSVIKGAKGGIVPPGFPNDTYPALLSSDEIILPFKKYKEYLDMPLESMTKNGLLPSASPDDELQLLMATYEMDFPEEKFKSLFAPMLKRPQIMADQSKRQKSLSKVVNYNNITSNITKLSKQRVEKEGATVLKYLSKFSKEIAVSKSLKNIGNKESLNYTAKIAQLINKRSVGTKLQSQPTAIQRITAPKVLDNIDRTTTIEVVGESRVKNKDIMISIRRSSKTN